MVVVPDFSELEVVFSCSLLVVVADFSEHSVVLSSLISCVQFFLLADSFLYLSFLFKDDLGTLLVYAAVVLGSAMAFLFWILGLAALLMYH